MKIQAREPTGWQTVATTLPTSESWVVWVRANFEYQRRMKRQDIRILLDDGTVYGRYSATT